MRTDIGREREVFRLEYIRLLKRLIARGEQWLAQAESWGVKPLGVADLKREIEECRKDLAFFSKGRPASKPRRAERVPAK